MRRRRFIQPDLRTDATVFLICVMAATLVTIAFHWWAWGVSSPINFHDQVTHLIVVMAVAISATMMIHVRRVTERLMRELERRPVFDEASVLRTFQPLSVRGTPVTMITEDCRKVLVNMTGEDEVSITTIEPDGSIANQSRVSI